MHYRWSEFLCMNILTACNRRASRASLNPYTIKCVRVSVFLCELKQNDSNDFGRKIANKLKLIFLWDSVSLSLSLSIYLHRNRHFCCYSQFFLFVAELSKQKRMACKKMCVYIKIRSVITDIIFPASFFPKLRE